MDKDKDFFEGIILKIGGLVAFGFCFYYFLQIIDPSKEYKNISSNQQLTTKIEDESNQQLTTKIEDESNKLWSVNFLSKNESTEKYRDVLKREKLFTLWQEALDTIAKLAPQDSSLQAVYRFFKKFSVCSAKGGSFYAIERNKNPQFGVIPLLQNEEFSGSFMKIENTSGFYNLGLKIIVLKYSDDLSIFAKACIIYHEGTHAIDHRDRKYTSINNMTEVNAFNNELRILYAINEKDVYGVFQKIWKKRHFAFKGGQFYWDDPKHGLDLFEEARMVGKTFSNPDKWTENEINIWCSSIRVLVSFAFIDANIADKNLARRHKLGVYKTFFAKE